MKIFLICKEYLYNVYFDNYKKLSKIIIFLALFQTINSIGQLVFPFLALFLTTKMNISRLDTGLFIFITGIGYLIGIFIGGYLADYLNKKHILIIGKIAMAICFLICFFYRNKFVLLVFLTFSNIFLGLITPAFYTSIINNSKKKNRIYAFSLIEVCENIGIIIAFLIGGFLIHFKPGLLFFGNFLFNIISLFFIIFLFPSDKVIMKDKNKDDLDVFKNNKNKSSLIILLKKPFLISYLFISSIFSFFYFQFTFSFPMYFIELFGKQGDIYFSFFRAGYILIFILCTPLITHYTKKNKSLNNLAVAGLFFCVGFALLKLILIKEIVICFFIMFIIGDVLFVTNCQVCYIKYIPKSHLGRFQVYFTIINLIGFGIGPLIMGLFLKIFQLNDAWLLLMFVAAFAALGYFVLNIIEIKWNTVSDKV